MSIPQKAQHVNSFPTTFTGFPPKVHPPILACVNRKYVGKAVNDWEDHTINFGLEALDLQGIADAIQDGYAISAAHHTRRHTDNFISAQHIGLDFDTEDERSCVNVLLTNPFLSQYATIFHPTSSHKPDAPRSRVFFVLDTPIKSAKQYVLYVRALLWKFGLADKQCSDAARLWFGAKDCELVCMPDKVLPVSVLDSLVNEQAAAQQAQARSCDVDTTIDTHAALQAAISRVTTGTRHATGFWLACKLRDSGMALHEAVGIMQQYQQAVEALGSHAYEWQEAHATLHGAYKRRPQGHSAEQVEKNLSLFEWCAWYGREGLKQGEIHYSLKSVFAVSEIMRGAKRTQAVALSVRSFNEYGMTKTTAARHLKAMVLDGLLIRHRKSDFIRGTTYSVNTALLQATAQGSTGHSGTYKEREVPLFQDCPIVSGTDIRQSATYRALQSMDYFRRGARIDARLWTTAPPEESFGAEVQRILATLADCPITSKSELFRLAGVNERTGRRKLSLLASLGFVCYEAQVESTAQVPYLTENWYERLLELAPALTTYGHGTLRAYWDDTQRVAHHARYIEQSKGVPSEVSVETAKNASERLTVHLAEVHRLNECRNNWALSQGILSEVPTVSLHSEGKTKSVRQPVKVARAGRIVIPVGHTHTGKNSTLKAERKGYIPVEAPITPSTPVVVPVAHRWKFVGQNELLLNELERSLLSEDSGKRTAAQVLKSYFDGAHNDFGRAKFAAYEMGVSACRGIMWGSLQAEAAQT